MKGLVLAGGLGSRLRPITHTLPKQLVPIANKPVIDYILEDLQSAGIDEVGIVLGVVGKDRITSHVGDGSEYGLEVSYIIQEEPRGPADAVLAAEDYIDEDPFIVYFGDTYLERNITKHLVTNFDPREDSLALVLQEVQTPSRYGIAEFDEDTNMRRVYEKPSDPPSDKAYVGVVGFTPEVYDTIENQEVGQTGELEITETIDLLVADDEHDVYWSTLEGLWKDVGTPEDVLHTNELVLKNVVGRSEGTVEDGATVRGPVDIANGAVVKSGASIKGPVSIGRNARIGADTSIGPFTSIGPDCNLTGAEIRSSILMKDVMVNGSLSINNSLIGEEVVIQGDRNPTRTELVVGEGARLNFG